MKCKSNSATLSTLATGTLYEHVYFAACSSDSCTFSNTHTHTRTHPRCLHPGDESPLEVCDVYWELKDSVARYELLLLRALRFDIYIQMPHTVSTTLLVCT